MRVLKLKSATIQEIVFRNDFKRVSNLLVTKSSSPNEFYKKDGYPKIVEIKGDIVKNSDAKNSIFDLPLSELEKEYNI